MRTVEPLLNTTAMPVNNSCVPKVARIGVSPKRAMSTPLKSPPHTPTNSASATNALA